VSALAAAGSAPEAVPTTELLANIRTQIEHYFSKENLQQDQHLVSLMDAQFYVPLHVVASFPRIRAMTTDLSTVRDALAGSTAVALSPDGAMLQPILSSERTTIIFREIPDDAVEGDLTALFDAVEGCPRPVKVRADVAGIWFVTMTSEKDAQAAIRALRSRTFRDAPLRMRLKSENALRAILTSQVRRAAAAGAPGPTLPATGAGLPMGGPMGVPNFAFGPGSGGPASADFVGPMAPAAFAPVVPTHIPAVTYTADQILAIAQGMGTRPEDVALPESARVDDFRSIFSRRPNPELLHRQRTQSVEASMASGRPRFDSVASVDVTSMHYGESERSRRKSSAAAARGVAVLGSVEPPAGATTAPAEAEMAAMMAQAFAKQGGAAAGAAPAAGRSTRGRADAPAGGPPRRGSRGWERGTRSPAQAPAPAAKASVPAPAPAAAVAAAPSVPAPAQTPAPAPAPAAAAGGKPKPAPYAAALMRAAPASPPPKAVVVRGRSPASGAAGAGSVASGDAEADAASAPVADASAAAAQAAATSEPKPVSAEAPAAAAEQPKPARPVWGSSFAAVLQGKPQ